MNTDRMAMEAGMAVHDHDLMNEKWEKQHIESSSPPVELHHGALTDEELAVEKKLRFKIDALVMPLVILVYLMNYIDRYEPLYETACT